MKKISTYLLAIVFVSFFSGKASAENISYEDRQAAYDLINSFSYGIDYYETDMLVSLFAEDGLFIVNYDGELVNTREGRADLYTEFSERVERRIRRGIGSGHHFFTNFLLDMPREGYMEGKVMALTTNRPSGEAVSIESHGSYEWEFKKEDGAWKIAKLEIFYN